MKSKLNLVWLLLLGLAFNPPAFADDEEGDEGTMELITDDQTEPEYVEHVAPNAHAMFGTEVSNTARDPESEFHGSDFGKHVANQVRQDVNQDVQHESMRDARADLRGDNAQGHRPE